MSNYNVRLKMIPEEIQRSLSHFLSDPNRYKMLEQQLETTGIMIENGDFQISIKTIEELENLYEILNEKFNILV